MAAPVRPHRGAIRAEVARRARKGPGSTSHGQLTDGCLQGLDMRTLALLAISGYQRYLSPHKGFCCAYREWTGARSCSALGKRVIQRYGLFSGIALLRRRFDKCGAAAMRLADRRSQSGFIDCACDIPTCDLPSCEWPSCNGPAGGCSSGLRDLSTCGDCAGCDCGDWKRDRRRQEQLKEVYIPPGKWEAGPGAPESSAGLGQSRRFQAREAVP